MRRSVCAIGLAALIAVCSALSLTAAAPQSADAAASGCAGKLIESRSMKLAGKKVGELNVYFNRATGKNCAKMNHAGKTWGKALRTRVWVGICSERKPGGKTCHYNPKTDAVDLGTYKYFAGPATTKTSARGRCIAASGYLWINGKRHTVSTQPWVGHCG
jgi:hypothetical protein